jgi:hypothetical protein
MEFDRIQRTSLLVAVPHTWAGRTYLLGERVGGALLLGLFGSACCHPIPGETIPSLPPRKPYGLYRAVQAAAVAHLPVLRDLWAGGGPLVALSETRLETWSLGRRNMAEHMQAAVWWDCRRLPVPVPVPVPVPAELGPVPGRPELDCWR